jgi:hypothetical protein
MMYIANLSPEAANLLIGLVGSGVGLFIIKQALDIVTRMSAFETKLDSMIRGIKENKEETAAMREVVYGLARKQEVLETKLDISSRHDGGAEG